MSVIQAKHTEVRGDDRERDRVFKRQLSNLKHLIMASDIWERLVTKEATLH